MPPNVLAVRFSSIGDVLLTTPLMRAIRVRHPEAAITFLVRADLAETIANNPRITRVVAWPRGSSLTDLAADLRRERWTHRLDLHCSLRSLALRQLVGGRWRGYPKHRVRRELLIRTRRRAGGSLGPVAERYFAAARGLDVSPDGGPPEFFTTPEADEAAAAFLGNRGLGGSRPLIALAPGAAHFTKRWPADHWVALAAMLSDRYDLVVVGGPAERDVGTAIALAAGSRGANAAGEFALTGTAAILKGAVAAVAGDTGVLHLATAVATPAVALYGPTVEEFGFFPYHGNGVVLQRELPCRPCSSRGGPVCPLGHHRCLVDITPRDVAAALRTLGV